MSISHVQGLAVAIMLLVVGRGLIALVRYLLGVGE
jgi:hypothetical protein